MVNDAEKAVQREFCYESFVSGDCYQWFYTFVKIEKDVFQGHTLVNNCGEYYIEVLQGFLLVLAQ